MYKNIIFSIIITFVVPMFFSACDNISKNKNIVPLSIEFGKFIDPRDNNTYKTVKINKQTWFAENLNFATDSSWFYNNDSIKYGIYKRFYTFEQAKKACPSGWHIPTESEWLILINTLGGKNSAGGKLKSEIKWENPNIGATNSSGFSALPSGYYDIKMGTFFLERINTSFWVAPNKDSIEVKYFSLYNDDSTAIINKPYKEYGLSVRCLKD